MPKTQPTKTRKKPKDKAADEVSLLLQARRYDTTGAINWANGPRGHQLMGAYAYILQEYGFSEGEIDKLMPALAFNTYLFVKKY